MIMRKHIIHNFSFYIHKKLNIQKIQKMKKKLNITLIFTYEKEWMRTQSEKTNLCLIFYLFFKTKNKRNDARVINEYST